MLNKYIIGKVPYKLHKVKGDKKNKLKENKPKALSDKLGKLFKVFQTTTTKIVPKTCKSHTYPNLHIAKCKHTDTRFCFLKFISSKWMPSVSLSLYIYIYIVKVLISCLKQWAHVLKRLKALCNSKSEGLYRLFTVVYTLKALSAIGTLISSFALHNNFCKKRKRKTSNAFWYHTNTKG